MKAVGGVGNGVFECVQDIVGYLDLCLIRYDDPDLYAALFRRMGEVSEQIWKRFLLEYGDAFCVCRFGDDLGFKTMTLIPEEDIRAHVVPAHRRIVELVHAAGKYGDRIGNFGGLDCDVLCSCSPAEVRERTTLLIRQAKPHGGFAFGTGNSVPDYIPVDAYLAMNEATRVERGE
jgi:uroporphyrinogen decarboxylase